MAGSAGRPLGPFALLLAACALVVLLHPASAETGAPALEIDGVWRSHGNWTVEDGEQVRHENETIEVTGSLTVEANATLTLLNVTVVFPAGAPSPRTLAVGEGASLIMTNVSLRAQTAGDRLVVEGGTALAERCTLSFEGQAGVPASVRVQSGRLALTDTTVSTEAERAIEARSSDLAAADAQMVNETGGPRDVLLAGPGAYTLDTTRFGTLLVENRPTVLLYATVRFFLFSPGGSPLAGRVNGTGPFGEFFFLNTAPNSTASMRVKWLDLQGAQENLTAAQRRSLAPVVFTAVSDGVGGNTSSAFIEAPRLNVTVFLDFPLDLSVEAFTIVGGTLESLGLKRAYYIDMNATQDVHIRVQNRGFAPSPAATLAAVRTALNGSSWRPEGEQPFGTLQVPALGPGESVNLSLTIVAGRYGGFSDASSGCTSSISYTSELSVALVQGAPGDFRPWNDAARFTMVAYEVHARYGPGCPTPTADALPLLGAAAVAAVAAFVVFTRWFSEGQVARRAARREEAKRPPP